MKKIFFIIGVLFSLAGFSQEPGFQKNKAYIFRLIVGGEEGGNFGLPNYEDTTAANLDLGDDRCGCLIFTTSDSKIWKRVCVPSKKWEDINSGGGGSGTVTQVNTGYGAVGGPITTTGTIAIDSASIATRARVQKGIDSVASLVGGASFWNLSGDSLTAGSQAGSFIGSTNNVSMRFRTNNTQRAILDSVGNFGLNISAPVQRAEFGASGSTGVGGYDDNIAFTSTNPIALWQNVARTSKFGIAFEPTTLDVYEGIYTGGSWVAVRKMNWGGDYQRFSWGKTGFNTTGVPTYNVDVVGTLHNTTAAHLATSSGNVGIGNTSPAEKLDVTGNIVASGTIAASNIGGSSTTPTASLITNADAATPYEVHWQRVGNSVSFSGMIDIDATAGSGALIIELTLPVASDFSSTTDASGWMVLQAVPTPPSGYIIANSSTNKIKLTITATSTSSVTYSFGGHYKIL